ncbi:MAG: DoxX family protein [Bacteroidales bacterium]|nr:DoxX family protein [Bacteroidales bacterium]MBK7628151.1 DoxX family protein [Bacteroidales bacterium]
MRILKIVARIIVGLTFIFSGFVKAVDPFGSAYKFHDYFQAFDLGFLKSLSLPLAILLCTAEFIAGFAVLSGIRQKTGIWVVILLMAIFTPLTFILALTNPVSDCGCFGDAIHLTNWQTFWKNIVIVSFAIVLFANRKLMKSLFKSSAEWAIISAIILLFTLFSFYNLRYLPVIDFLPYKTGVKIADKMIMPEGVAADEYHTTFIYEKDGIQKEFELSNYPANDTTWHFIDQKSVLVKKGYQPPIHDFVISSATGDDLTQKILSEKGYSVLMVTKKLAEAGEDHLSDGFEFGRFCIVNGIGFYILTSSGSDEVKSYENGLQFCSADETTLKTMVRSNPGYLLLRDGTIIGKWSWANLPSNEWFEKLTSESK